MAVERIGLVARVEEDLERVIALGLLPKDGFLPSEQLLARRQGVSRATAREALLRLAAKGLVVQHPGRRSRAVPLSQAVTLENLSVVLHTEGSAHSDGRRLLEGYFALKRDTMVELLASCCERASEEELRQLGVACFVLGETAPWEPQSRWAEREFELLRLAALIAHRPGHFLLVQSLERSFWGMARRLLPHMDGEAIRQWSRCAVGLLDDRDVQALRRELPVLLQASDEQLLRSLSPDREVDNALQPQSVLKGPLQAGPSEQMSEKGRPPGAEWLDRSTCQTGSGDARLMEAPLPASELGSVLPNRSACQTALSQLLSTGGSLPDAKGGVVAESSSNRSSCHTGSSHTQPTETFGLELEERKVGMVSANWSACHIGADDGRPGCQTGSCRAPPTWRSPRDPSSACSGQLSGNRWSPVPWARVSAPVGVGHGQALAALRVESSLVTAARSLSRWGSSNSRESGSNWKSACLSLSSACIAASPDCPA